MTNSGFKKQADALRRNARTSTKYLHLIKKPVQLQELLGKPNIPPGTYQISETTNILSPKSLPKSGDLVLIEPGACPKEMATNIVYVKDLSDNAFVYDAWVPTYKFYLLQMVIFWRSGIQYEYQIQMSDSDDPKIAKFVLVNQYATERQPGGSYRVPQKTRID